MECGSGWCEWVIFYATRFKYRYVDLIPAGFHNFFIFYYFTDFHWPFSFYQDSKIFELPHFPYLITKSDSLKSILRSNRWQIHDVLEHNNKASAEIFSYSFF